MLRCLEVTGLGLFSEAHLEFSPGFNVLTGETGAGKSMVLSALGLLVGVPVPRASSRVRIEAELDLQTDGPESRSGLGSSAGIVRVGLELGKSGRSRAFLDGSAVPASHLRALTARCLLLTPQHAVREIASRAGVLGVLDSRAGLGQLRRDLADQLSALSALDAQLKRVLELVRTSPRDLQALDTAIDQIEALAPGPDEHARLMQARELRGRSEEFLQVAQSVSLTLFEREASVEAELLGLLHKIRRVPRLEALERLGEQLCGVLSALETAGREASRLAEHLGLNVEDPAGLEERIESFDRLSRRLGVAHDELGTHAERLRARRIEIEGLGEQCRALEQSRGEIRERAAGLAAELHRKRAEETPRLREDLLRELAALTLPHANVCLELEAPSQNPVNSGGFRVAFSANPGEAPQPLERVASGGERSRLALALCCIGAARGKTLVFDEIDQGVGGDAALAVAERLQRLGRSQQVLCVTHQAAIAARADAHFRVSKRSNGGLTLATVERLDDQERTRELSRMLSGGQPIAASRTLARQLLLAGRRAA